jgi:hypothetical protein
MFQTLLLWPVTPSVPFSVFPFASLRNNLQDGNRNSPPHLAFEAGAPVRHHRPFIQIEKLCKDRYLNHDANPNNSFVSCQHPREHIPG